MRRNPILDTDSYKLSHDHLYDPTVTNIYSYLESRGGKGDYTVFFGGQPFVRQLVENPVTRVDIDEAADFAAQHGEPFNRDGWNIIVDEYGGYLPLRIKAVAEGTLVPKSNILLSVENTDPRLKWLTSYKETPLLRPTWYGTSVATRIFGMKVRIKAAFDKSAEDFSGLPFALLDFSSRGCSSYETNEIGGAAYLAHFLGSDSLPAVRFVNRYYDSAMSGFSVPASEHSVTTSWGRDRSIERKRWMIRNLPPGSILSDVLDTWDCYEEARQWVSLKDELAEHRHTLVGRPDSGEIEYVLPGLIHIFGQGFGVRENSKGYAVINGAKLLWGDGINEDEHMVPFNVAMGMGYSAESIMTGCGAGLMQKNLDRDTHKFAFKASAVSRDKGRTWEGIRKEPITDPGKRSKMGRLHLIGDDHGSYRTVDEEGYEAQHIPHRDGGMWRRRDYLRTIYENGEVMNLDSIDTIRARIDSQL